MQYICLQGAHNCSLCFYILGFEYKIMLFAVEHFLEYTLFQIKRGCAEAHTKVPCNIFMREERDDQVS